MATFGTAVAIEAMSSEALADALEDHMIERLDQSASARSAQTTERPYRRGLGSVFVLGGSGDGVFAANKLEPMPASPTLLDFFKLRFAPANHVLQSATRALKTGMNEETILACLLHDVVLSLIKPYVSERVSWAIRYHQALRFYPDTSVGYEYPEMYNRIFGKDYVPVPHVKAAYTYARNHKWYRNARLMTVNDVYAFDPNAKVSMEPFIDIIGRHFKQPKEGLGNDNSPVAHMWRTLASPNQPL